MEDIYDVKGLIEILPFWQEHLTLFSIVGGLVLIGIIFLIYFIIKKLRKPTQSLEAHLTPYEKAIRDLTNTKEFLQPGMDKLLSVKISDIIRHYLENAFHFHASEKTTEEFLYKIQQNMTFSSKPLTNLATFLEMCDLAKFAKIQFTPHDQKILYEKAHLFLTQAHQEEPQSNNLLSSISQKEVS